MRAAKAIFHALMLSLAALAAGLTAAGPASAGPALLFEPATGKVLYAEDPDNLWFPASLTKIMTAYATFHAVKEGKLKLDDPIRCSLVATLQPPSKVGLPVGGELTVDVALQAIIVKSANDVTVMLAEAVAGSEMAFVDLMNAHAKKLGMTRTHFANTNGLPDPNQYTTARDLARLASAVVKEFPEYAHYWSAPEVRVGKRRLGSHNALLKTFPGADGLKTGFTCDSGFNVVASATRDGRRLMAVVLGEASGNERAIRAASLLEHGFLNYGWKEVFNTTSLDTLNADANAKSLVSVRSEVLSWDCGHRPKRSKAVAGKKKKSAPAANEAAGNKSSKKDANATKEPKAAPALKGTNGAALTPTTPKQQTQKPAKAAAADTPTRTKAATP
jgi:D-alanyl-D-alanine carboxypeptidase